MRICHVIPSLRATMGGVTVTTVGLARELGIAGFEQLILTTGDDKREQDQELKPTSGGSKPLPVNRLRSMGPPQYGITLERRRVDSAMHWAEAVSIHGIWNVVGLLAMRSARRQATPYIVHAHGMLDPRALSRNAGRKRLAGNLAFLPAVRGAAAIVYGCDQERRDAESSVMRLPPGVVVPYAVDPPPAPPATSDVAQFRAAFGGADPAPRLLFLGRLDVKKRPDLAIEAVASLKRAGRLVRLALVGEGKSDYVASLSARATRLGVSDRVHFPGPLYGTAKWAAFAASDAYVLPSEQESLAVTVLEAAAAGLPIVTTPYVAGWQEIAAIGRLRTTETNAEAVANGWATLLDRLAEERRLAAEGAPEIRRTFSNARGAALLADVYKRVVKARTP